MLTVDGIVLTQSVGVVVGGGKVGGRLRDVVWLFALEKWKESHRRSGKFGRPVGVAVHLWLDLL